MEKSAACDVLLIGQEFVVLQCTVDMSVLTCCSLPGSLKPWLHV